MRATYRVSLSWLGTAKNFINTYVPDDVLLSMWRIVYWSAQMLTWLVLPLMQSYATAGDFTSVGRLKTALINNAIYYGVYLIIFVLLLVYAVLRGIVINTEHLKVMLISASNTWGLLLLVGLLGYGLVEVPRQLWHAATRGKTWDYDYRLNKVYFKLDQKSTEKNDAEDSFRDAYKEARSVLNALKTDHIARVNAQVIAAKFDDQSVATLFPTRSGADFATLADADPITCSSEKYLIRLHQRVIEVVQTYHRTESQWKTLMDEALFLEDVQQATLTRQLPGYAIHGIWPYLPTKARYYWHVVLQRPLAKVLSILFASMTLFILISECTFFIVEPTISPAALLLQNAAERFHYTYTQCVVTWTVFQLVSMALITYVCGCAYTTLFRLRIYKYYHLDGNKLTDENSLLFSATLLCRLTPPICLNLLGLMHLDSHITHQKNLGVETQFTKLMGHLDLLPILAKGINIYLPLLILVFCALTYYKLGTLLMHTLGVDQFVDSDDVTMDAVSAGKALAQLERNRRARRDRDARDNDAELGQTRSSTRGVVGLARQGVMSSTLSQERIPFVQEEETEYDQHSLSANRSMTRGGSSLGPALFSAPSRGSTPWEHPASDSLFDDL